MNKHLLIIPLFNEGKYIEDVIKKVRDHFSGSILAINDGSTDNSGEILRKIKGIKVIEQMENCGYGCALMQGFNHAIENHYDVAVTMDCDDQHEPHLIPNFLYEISNYDIVSGSRYLSNFGSLFKDPPLDRKQINQEITVLINQHTGYNLTDTFCGFKAYKVSAIKKLNLDEPGYGFPLQLWLQAKKNGLTIKEIPVGLIYKNLNRTFGNNLDNPTNRKNYYLSVIEREFSLS
jgi:dolichol-phosphate mannosyltransferase